MTLVRRGSLLIVALLLGACSLLADPPGPRDCECELIGDWAANLPMTPDGELLDIDQVSTTETADGFSVGGSREDLPEFDRVMVEEALTAAGFNMRTDVEDADSWHATFFPEESAAQSAWAIDFTQEASGVGIRIAIEVDGTPWGLETIENLWDSYQEDYEAALQAQVERQEEAIAKLQDLEAAMQGMVVDEP